MNKSNVKCYYPLLLVVAMLAWSTAYAVLSPPTPVVVGHKPTVDNILLDNTAPVSGALLNVTYNYHDRDDDKESGTLVEWLLDGQEPPIATGNSVTVPSNATGKTLQARITPRSVALANPEKGNPVSSAAVTIAATQTWPSNFTKPETAGVNYSQAAAYCNNLNPKARLPTIKELQALFVNSTSATIANGSQINEEMCTKHGWPLGGASSCGGNSRYYWTSEPGISGRHNIVNMNNGNKGLGNDTTAINQVTCVR